MNNDFDYILDISLHKTLIENRKNIFLIRKFYNDFTSNIFLSISIAFLFSLFFPYFIELKPFVLNLFSFFMAFIIFFYILITKKDINLKEYLIFNNKEQKTTFYMSIISSIIASLVLLSFNLFLYNYISLYFDINKESYDFYIFYTEFLLIICFCLFYAKSSFNLISLKYQDFLKSDKLDEYEKNVKENLNEIPIIECYIAFYEEKKYRSINKLLVKILNERIREEGYKNFYEYKKTEQNRLLNISEIQNS